MLRDVVEAPPQPSERHHPVRLFIGSGMPRGLWRRIEERFRPARVLEFYASTEVGAILVNVRGAKQGSMGRPLPGAAEVRIAAYDLDAPGLALDPDGFAEQCGVDEVGLLLARVSPSDPLSVTPFRSLFARDDAWVATGDLFRRDADGDYWLVDSLANVVRTVDGSVFTAPIRDALDAIPAVDLAVAYGVPVGNDGREIVVAALSLREGRSLRPRDLGQALSALPSEGRPRIVHVVDRIPVTTWFRPMTQELRAAGIPDPDSKGEKAGAWFLDASGQTYRPLTEVARKRIAGERKKAKRRAASGPSTA
jgi:putative long chain acyl-CoA synthase